MENKKILIVEDDDFLLQMYVTKLELEGFQVVSAVDGIKGLRLAKKDKPDLVLLDLQLPELSGFEVLEDLKRSNETKQIPVLVLTNFSQKEDIDRCLNLGASDYLIKAHFVPSEVIAKIKNILEEVSK
jgi:DNA-binding response OmpR family regulator